MNLLLNLNKKAVVTVKDRYEQYHTFISKGSNPVALAAAILKVDFPTDFRAGKVMTSLLHVVEDDPRYEAMLVSAPARVLMNDDLHIYVSKERPGYPSFKVYRYRNGHEAHLFSGSLPDFAVWAKTATEPQILPGQTVIFWYEGGSQEGNRAVLVDNIKGINGGQYICGTDLRKDEYRQYDVRHIRGDIFVLNTAEKLESVAS